MGAAVTSDRMHSQLEGAPEIQQLRSLFSPSAKNSLTPSPHASPGLPYVIMATKTGPHAVSTILPIAYGTV
jgi:hypothetical protein